MQWRGWTEAQIEREQGLRALVKTTLESLWEAKAKLEKYAGG